jgi:signal transduction histidine kinase
VIDLARATAQEEIAQARESDAPLDGEYIGGRLDRIGQQIERASRIVSDLRNFVRGYGPEDLTLFNPVTALHGAINLTQHGFRQAGIVASVTLTDPLPLVGGHVSRLEQVLVNLINNARDAGAKTIELRCGRRPDDHDRTVCLAVIDDGPGIPDDMLPRLFREFVTTKPRGKGTGLGLRICRRIIEEMGGTIAATNRPEGGTCFEILLPAAI